MNVFFKRNLPCIVDVCKVLGCNRFIGKLSLETIDKHILPHLYDSFSTQYQPRITTGDGNCLWNMISLDICGSEMLMACLRFLTVIGLLWFKIDFYRLIENRFKNLDEQFPENQAKIKFESILRDAIENYEFGNEYHLQVLSTVLSRNIYVYSYFTKSGKLILPSNISSKDLLNHFDDKNSKSSLIGQHIRYEPIKNTTFYYDENLKNENLYGFFSGSWKHYSALIPKTNQTIIYKPKLNVFLQYDSC